MERADREASRAGPGVRAPAIAAFVLAEAAICALRLAAVRPRMAVPGRIPYLFLWGFAGTVVAALVFSLWRDATWRLPLAFLAPDLLVFALQRATGDVEGQFYALNFVTPWQAVAAAGWAGGLLRRAPVPSPGPSWLGKPAWRWGLFLVPASLLLQVTPKPQLLAPLETAIAFVSFGGLLLGLALFVAGGAMRLARRH
jgi:hypothetical protein